MQIYVIIIVISNIANTTVGSFNSEVSLAERSIALYPMILRLPWFYKEMTPFLPVICGSLLFNLVSILPNQRLSSKREFTLKSLLASPPSSLYFPRENLGLMLDAISLKGLWCLGWVLVVWSQEYIWILLTCVHTHTNTHTISWWHEF